MKKNIYLIIITIITVVCIIAGSLYHIGGFALDLFDNLIPRSDKSLGNVCTEELSVDEFSNLVFDTTISNINVKTGDSYMVSYKCNKRLVPKIKSSGDTLTISQSNRANYKRNTTSEITINNGTMCRYPSKNESGICEYENSNLIIKAKKNEIAMMHISIKASTNALKTHCLSLPMYESGFSGPSHFVLSFRLFVSFFMSSLLLI